MEALGQYILSITAGAILCSVLLTMFAGSGYHAMLKVLCGVFLALTAVRPVSGLDLDTWISEFTFSYSLEGEAAAAFGEKIYSQQESDIIKAETEAYILDKAADMGITLDVEVRLSQDKVSVPAAVTLRGKISPYAQELLSQCIANDLGISKENQIWTG